MRLWGASRWQGREEQAAATPCKQIGQRTVADEGWPLVAGKLSLGYSKRNAATPIAFDAEADMRRMMLRAFRRWTRQDLLSITQKISTKKALDALDAMPGAGYWGKHTDCGF